MKKRDIIFICVILAVALLSLVAVILTRQTGVGVVVKIDGKEAGKYPLNVNATYELNGGTNTLIIEDGVAFLVDADCPDKLCVRQGKISKKGQTITCLPNKLTVSVCGADKGDVDIIS